MERLYRKVSEEMDVNSRAHAIFLTSSPCFFLNSSSSQKDMQLYGRHVTYQLFVYADGISVNHHWESLQLHFLKL